MPLRIFNLYFIFFSIAISAAVFPSSLGNYPGFIIPLGIGIFVLDELILLFSLALMFFYFLINQKISNQINGYGGYLAALLVFFIAVFLVSIFRENNSLEIVSRDRWIILNSFAALMPFIYRPTIGELENLYNRFATFLIFLTSLKFINIILDGSEQLSQFGPSFTFLLNACLAIYIWSGKGVLKKTILSVLVFLISIFGEQISGILMAIACIFIPTYFLIFKISFFSIFFLFLLSIAGSLVVINIDILEIASSLSLNPRNFEIAQKLLSYIALWTKPFEGITFFEVLFGRGAGFSTTVFTYNEVFDEFGVANHSLAHNLFITIIIKFGLLGFSFFCLLLFLIYKPFSEKFVFKHSTILKILLILILINFFTTPGIWKIRKGFFMWFIIGLIYFYRRQRAPSIGKNA